MRLVYRKNQPMQILYLPIINHIILSRSTFGKKCYSSCLCIFIFTRTGATRRIHFSGFCPVPPQSIATNRWVAVPCLRPENGPSAVPAHYRGAQVTGQLIIQGGDEQVLQGETVDNVVKAVFQELTQERRLWHTGVGRQVGDHPVDVGRNIPQGISNAPFPVVNRFVSVSTHCFYLL